MTLYKESTIGHPISPEVWNRKLSILNGEEIAAAVAPFHKPLILKPPHPYLQERVQEAYKGIGLGFHILDIYQLTQLTWNGVYRMDTTKEGALHRMLDPQGELRKTLEGKNPPFNEIETLLSASLEGRNGLQESITESLLLKNQDYLDCNRADVCRRTTQLYERRLYMNLIEALSYQVACLATGDKDQAERFARFTSLFGDGNYILGVDSRGISPDWTNYAIVLAR